MSLDALATHMASKGRNGDSMLVHMSPSEVQALQALAERHGTTLTINPETGQPEAFSLKSLLPMIAGAALGPAGFGLFSSALAAGAAVGGVTALATGSLSRGLMAGIGAYGGSGLAEGLMGAGTGALAGEATKAAAIPAEQAGDWLAQESANKGITEQLAQKTMGEKLSAGLGAVTSSPAAAVDFAKANLKPLAAAASPIMADAMVPTTTKAPDVDTGNIRKFSYDPYGQTYTPLGVYPAKGYQGMADGGIVALADGGSLTPPAGWGVAGGAYDTPEEKIAYFNQNNITPEQLLSANQGVTQTDIDWMLQHGYAGNTVAPGSNKYVENVKNWFEENPTATTADVQSAIKQYNLNPQDVADAMKTAGLSGAAQYSAFHQDIGSSANVEEDYGGLKGLSSNINYWLQQNPRASMGDIQSEMDKWGVSDADVLRATGKTLDQLAFKQAKQTMPYGNVTEDARTSTPGDIVRTPDNAVTVTPNIPGRPVGGFTGIEQVKDTYTAGGGSLGQTNLFVPKTVEDMYARYGNTGGSQQAYDYLMGKGSVDIKKPWTPTGELMKPYAESVMGVPTNLATKKYIFDQATRTYKLNPDYQPLAYDSKGNRVVSASTNQISTAIGKGDPAIQALVDAGTVDYIALAAMLGITVQEAQKRFPKTGTTTATAAAANTNVSDTTYGGYGGADVGGIGAVDGGSSGASTSGGMSNSGEGGGDSAVGGWAYGGMVPRMALGGLGALAAGGQAQYNLGGYSDGGRLLKGPGDGVSDSIPATIGDKQPARLADGEFVVPARIVSELGNGSTDAGARKLYAMMDRVQKARGKTTGKGRVAKDTRSDKYLPA